MLTSKQFQQKVLRWYDQFGRKDLPWQKNKTPYRVWVSEIMLQQTQVKTVIPYFDRFIKQFPTVKKLALAKQDDVLALWSGLGYYARARNLHRAANMIMAEHKGRFPKDIETLQTLPGIGRSTAGAIVSFTQNKPATILDGNVKRLLIRFYAIDKNPKDNKTIQKLWELAENLTPEKRIADYTQVMMDLGATLCTRTKPNCNECPLQKNCKALATGSPENYPIKVKSKKIPTREIYLLVIHHHDKILLEKRPPTGIWGSLWSLPELKDKKTLKQDLKKRFGLTLKNQKSLPTFRHTFSHFHLNITPIAIEVTPEKRTIMSPAGRKWCDLKQLKNLGLPQPVRKLLLPPSPQPSPARGRGRRKNPL